MNMPCWEALSITEQHKWIGYASSGFEAVRDHVLANLDLFKPATK